MRKTARHKAISALGALLVSALCAACGPQTEEPAPKVDAVYPMRALSFAGVDLRYALRRIAGEADLLLVVDEYRPFQAQHHDLSYVRVDLDLAAGPVDIALAQLHQHVGGVFEYSVEDGLLLARSQRAKLEQRVLDEKILPAAQLDVSFVDLVTWILRTEPATLVGLGDSSGRTRTRVKLDIPDQSSVMDVLIQFARALPTSMHILRAGYEYLPGVPDRVVSNAIGLWGKLVRSETLPPYRRRGSLVYVLAQVADRTDAIICVLDRSMLNDARGSLDFGGALDRGWPLDTAVERLARFGSKYQEVKPVYSWKLEDGIYRVRSSRYDFFLPGQDLMDQALKGGSFKGTLGQLARWINQNRTEPSPKVLVSGEMNASWPVAELEIAPGTTVEQVLYQFARASGEGWYIVIKDSVSPVVPLEGTWAGAFLTRLVDWGAKGWESPSDKSAASGD